MLLNKQNSIKQVSLNASGVKSFALAEQQNIKSRSYMEDNFFIQNCPKSILFGVFDGHGGPTVSNYLVKNFPGVYLQDSVDYKIKIQETKEQCRNTFLIEFFICKLQIIFKADQRITQYNLEDGSTGTVGIILLQQQKRVLYIAHVGDSTGYLFSDNNAQKLTDEHRGQNVFEAHRIQQQFCYVFRQSGGKLIMNRVGGVLAVTRAFGDIGLKSQGLIAKPQLKRVPLRLHHRYIIVASDGLWDYVGLKTIQQIIKQEVQADDIAFRLIKVAISQGSTDNVTAIVIRL